MPRATEAPAWDREGSLLRTIEAKRRFGDVKRWLAIAEVMSKVCRRLASISSSEAPFFHFDATGSLEAKIAQNSTSVDRI